VVSIAMPIFEYICRDCHHRFETLVTGSRTPSCPTCASVALDKQLSVFAVSSSSSPASRDAAPAGGGCGTCGDPRGPGACNLN
jgi:putative FmdB family regulatory protein